jgi:hypothetical protein
MNIIDMPANPAHMGIPEINKPNALPNKRIARTYSFIADFPYNILKTGYPLAAFGRTCFTGMTSVVSI